jgi:hypothetical protein
MAEEYPHLEHGRLYTLRLGDGTPLPVIAWRTEPRFPWQFLGTCPEDDRCVHAREPHMLARMDGSFEIDESTESSPYDLDRRAVAEGLTVHDLQPANRMAIALFRAMASSRYPCPRCEAQLGVRHHPSCHAENLVPLFPTFARASWLDAIATGGDFL